jgi:hypothetical protein
MKKKTGHMYHRRTGKFSKKMQSLHDRVDRCEMSFRRTGFSLLRFAVDFGLAPAPIKPIRLKPGLLA